MRAAMFALALAACSPEIAPGSYYCGPEQACPEDQECDGPTNLCVLPSAAQPFACAPGAELEPNDSFANAQELATNLTCVSRVVEALGCEERNDGEDWFSFDVPGNCVAVAVDARLTFPIAFETLELELRDASGATLATGGACSNEAADDADDRRCLRQTVAAGGRYAVRIARSGAGTCEGACSHNRYTLNLQLITP